MRIANFYKLFFIFLLFISFHSELFSQTPVISKYGIEVFGGMTIPIADLKNQPSSNSYGIGVTGIYSDSRYYSLFLNISYNRVKAPDSIDVNNLPLEGITKLVGGVIINLIPKWNIPYIEAGVGMYYLQQFDVHYVITDAPPSTPQFTESSISKFGYTVGLGQRFPVDKKSNILLKIKFNSILTKPVSKNYFEILGGYNYNF